MSLAISIQFSPEAQQVLKSLKALPQRLLVAIREGMDEQNLITVSHIQRRYLSYPKTGPSQPDGLRFQSGRYRQTLRSSKAVISGQAVISGIGSNAKSKSGFNYPAVHEFGFTGNVMVGGHVRQRTQKQKFIGATPKKTVTRTVRVGDVNVAAHSRRINLPAREPIQRGIRDMLDEYTRVLSGKIMDAWRSQSA